ncbi:MAG: ABC transporter ATP-binding protein [Candidatus Levybacteria bacterium]|nr:ABC transporter ATP-binding protein [Candidatus Levybacteria bacterium]
MSNVILEVKNLTKQFPAKGWSSSGRGNYFTAVDDISFTVKSGEIVGFLGPNGAGKTTTMQMLLGVLTPTSGIVAYFGKDLHKHREEVLEQVNFSTTYTQFPWRLTVAECLTFISYLYDIPNRKERINRIVESFRLEKLLKKEIANLSAGQKTRVNLAKAFINYPKVLLLDEPTASLDPEVALHVRNIIEEQRKTYDVSVLITSHNMAEIEELCDRVIFINNGKIIADDLPQNLAKKIAVSHIELLVSENMEKLIEYCEKQKLSYSLKGKYIRIDMQEKELSDFLQKLSREQIVFDEISIDKPSLEDYFFSIAKVK